MYTFIQQYTYDPKVSATLLHALETTLVPRLRTMPDFVAYYWLDLGVGAGAALCMFEEQASAESSLALAAALVQDYAPINVAPAQVIRGKVKIHAVCSL